MAKLESYRDLVDRMFGELGDIERQSLLLAIRKLDEAAQSLGIDVVAELKNGHTLTSIFEIIRERQQKRSA
jgi:hypothetical protein